MSRGARRERVEAAQTSGSWRRRSTRARQDKWWMLRLNMLWYKVRGVTLRCVPFRSVPIRGVPCGCVCVWGHASRAAVRTHHLLHTHAHLTRVNALRGGRGWMLRLVAVGLSDAQPWTLAKIKGDVRGAGVGVMGRHKLCASTHHPVICGLTRCACRTVAWLAAWLPGLVLDLKANNLVDVALIDNARLGAGSRVECLNERPRVPTGPNVVGACVLVASCAAKTRQTNSHIRPLSLPSRCSVQFSSVQFTCSLLLRWLVWMLLRAAWCHTPLQAVLWMHLVLRLTAAIQSRGPPRYDRLESGSCARRFRHV